MLGVNRSEQVTQARHPVGIRLLADLAYLVEVAIPAFRLMKTGE